MPALSNRASSSSTGALLAQTPLFRSLSPQRLERFCHAATERSHPKGQVLYQRDEPAKLFYVIRSGWVKLFRETLDGEEAVADILTAHHVFGETALFLDGHYNESAQVVEHAALLEIPSDLLRQEIVENPGFATALLEVMSRFRRRQTMEIEHLNL